MTRFKPVLVAVLPVVLLFGIVEVTLRASGTPETVEDRYTPGFRYSASLGWDREPSFAGTVEESYREFDANGLLRTDSLELADGTGPRVLFLGGSNTFGFGVDADSTFVELTEVAAVRSINAGQPDFSTLQGLLLLQRLDPMVQPDIIVAEFGVHDRVSVRPSRVDGAEYFRRLHGGATGRAVAFLMHSHAIRWFRAWLVKAGAIDEEPRCTSIDSIVPRVSPQGFRENLTAMAQIAARRNSRLIMLRIGMAPRPRRELDLARELLARSEFDSAQTLLGEMIAEDDFCCAVIAHRMLLEIPRPMHSARRNDPPVCVEDRAGPLVPAAEYLEIMREVAAFTGADMVNAQDSLDDVAMFRDDNHLSTLGHRRLASILTPLLNRKPDSTSNLREPGLATRPSR